MFYKAMIIFVKKHYGKNSGSLSKLLLQIAISLRASVSVAANFSAKTLVFLKRKLTSQVLMRAG